MDISIFVIGPGGDAVGPMIGLSNRDFGPILLLLLLLTVSRTRPSLTMSQHELTLRSFFRNLVGFTDVSLLLSVDTVVPL